MVYGYNRSVPESVEGNALARSFKKQETTQETPWHMAALDNMLMVKRGNKTSLRALDIPHTGQSSWP